MNILMNVSEGGPRVITVAMRAVEESGGEHRLSKKVTDAIVEVIKRELRREVEAKLIDGARFKLNGQDVVTYL